jgi:hypothetical protein
LIVYRAKKKLPNVFIFERLPQGRFQKSVRYPFPTALTVLENSLKVDESFKYFILTVREV